VTKLAGAILRVTPATDGKSPKPARKAPPGRPFRGAEDPRNGRGPKKGAPNAGRPSLEHIEWCKRVLSDPKVEAGVFRILHNPKHPQFTALWAKIAERGYGRIIEQGGEEQLRPTGEQVVAELVQLLPRVLAILPVDGQELARLLADRRRVEVLMSGNGDQPHA
jgi:hypothetical protein